MRLRSRYEYKRMAARGKRHRATFFTIDVRLNGSASTRLGITVTKRFGDAHLRNRFKRVIREAFRLCYSQLIGGVDINIRPLEGAAELGMAEARAELVRHLSKSKSCDQESDKR
jgi:ribonuclease P protein component